MLPFQAVRRVEVLLLAVMLMTAFCLPARAADALAALVTDARGKVEIQRPGQAWSPASVMGRVPPGSQVRVAAGGQAALSFVQGGLKVRLVGPVTAQVDAAGARAVAGPPTNVQSTRPDGRTAMSVPGGVNINKMGGQLARGTPALAFVSGPAFLSPQPVIAWLSNADRASGHAPTYDGYKVKITDADGKVVKTDQVSGKTNSYQVPAGTLVTGKTYRVAVSAFPSNEPDPPSVRQDLKVLDDATRAQVVAARTEATAAFRKNPNDVTPLAVLTYVYLDNGMKADAIEVCEKIVAARPDAHDAALLLDKLYRDMGLVDKARVLEKKTGVEIKE